MSTTPKTFDFIIIGSGIAGLNAALQASQKGNVLIITKKKLSDCNTSYAQGGIATVLAKTDHFQKHVADTMKAGAYHNDRKAVNFIIKRGPTAIRRLIKLGVQFSKTPEGKISLGREGGHGENRIAHSGDFTGKTIEDVLIKQVRRNPRISVLENTFAKDLIVEKKACYGVETMREAKGKIIQESIFGRRIILATGGLGQIYEKTTNPEIATGDGIAMAFRAGCKLKDLEFIQFHPTAFLEDKSPQFLLSEALRGEGAILRNAKGERFMNRYDPRGELAPRDVVSRAIFEEEKKGTVFLDLRLPSSSNTTLQKKHEAELKKRFPQIFTYLKKQGYNLAKDLIPITPVAHFSCGGIVTDLKGQTNIKNLFAFGEVACTGLHGANRLASNSLLEGLVMSNEILKTPLQKNSKFSKFQIPNNIQTEKISKDRNEKIASLKRQVQKIMWEKVGIVRNKKGLIAVKKKLKSLGRRMPLSFKTLRRIPILEELEALNMIQAARLVTQAALKRQKSLGGHFIDKS